MRLILAALGALCCIALGFQAARHVKEREKCLDGWEQALMHMEGAVKAGGLPVPSLLEAGGTDYLRKAAALLRENPALAPDQLTALLPKESHLTGPEWDVIAALLSGLFAPDRERQLQSLSYARKQLERYARICREAGENNIRLYQSLGWLSGAAVFILMC